MAPRTLEERTQRSTQVQSTPKNHEAKKKKDYCKAFTNVINGALEEFFARLGLLVAQNPYKVILISLLISGLCLIGVTELQEENRGEKNWVSQDSDPIKHKEWIDEFFPIAFRDVGLLLEHQDNMLNAAGLTQLYNISLEAKKIYKNEPEKKWTDICYSPSKNPNDCIPSSILELWSYNITTISKLSEKDIMAKINEKNVISPMTGRPLNINLLVGGTTVANNSEILKATVLKMDFRLKKRDVFDEGKGLQVDEHADDWEEEFDNVFSKTYPGYSVYSYSRWSDQKAGSDASNGDLQFFVIGYILVIIYLSIMLGSFSRINHKIYLALCGIIVIGMSIGISYGLGSAFQLKYTGVHNVLPFLLLGIGVDDIFVIVQSWDNIGGPIPDHRSISEKISLTIRHAGVSVLVTSVTDICAFAVGSATILPALRSFSIWCAIGILAIFVLTLTFFVAMLTLDARRQEKHRDACLCCMKLPEDYQPMQCADKKILKGFMKNRYSPVLLSTPGKVISLLAVAGLFAAGLYGVTELEQDFDFNWFLPKTSSPRLYVEKDREAFPDNGKPGNVYIGKINYFESWEEINNIKNTLENDAFIADGSVNSWYHSYHSWLYKNHQEDLVPENCTQLKCRAKNESEFYRLLDDFLLTEQGKNYKGLITFQNNTKDASKRDIIATKIAYKHIKLIGSAIQIDAMDSITEEIKPQTLPHPNDPLPPFAFAREYINFETNKVIGKELIRNLALAGLCVLVVSLFLLSNLVASIMVLACVALSLVNIAAFMGFWGLTIDTVTTIILVIAIGLTVDYSAHIAHGFMAAQGKDRNARVVIALSEVGPAVIHGGMSTLLAFLLLAASESYVFLTFFKVFFLVVAFGIFHGLVFLPVALSLIGPASYASTNEDSPRNANVRASSDNQPPVQLQKVTKQKDESFTIVVDENGKENIAYLPDQ